MKNVESIIEREILTPANELIQALYAADPDGYFNHWENDHDAETDEPTEIFEYYIVTDWLADQLANIGEPVARDFHGLCFWGRTTTGQRIEMDGTFQKIHKKLQASLRGALDE